MFGAIQRLRGQDEGGWVVKKCMFCPRSGYKNCPRDFIMSDLGGAIWDPLKPTITSKIRHHLGTFPNIQFHKKTCPFAPCGYFLFFFNLHVKKICRSGKKVALKNSVVAQEKFSFVEK